MSDKKQIEEMTKLLNRCAAECEEGCICSEKEHAEALYNAGYRKQIESEWQVTVLVDTPTMFRTGAPHCKNCKGTSRHRTAFCPHCGALMKGCKE